MVCRCPDVEQRQQHDWFAEKLVHYFELFVLFRLDTCKEFFACLEQFTQLTDDNANGCLIRDALRHLNYFLLQWSRSFTACIFVFYHNPELFFRRWLLHY